MWKYCERVAYAFIKTRRKEFRSYGNTLERVALKTGILNVLKAMGFNFVCESFIIRCIVRKNHCTTPLVKELTKKGLSLTLSSI